MIPINFNSMRERSETHLALCKALESKNVDPQEAVAREALADLIARSGDVDIVRVLEVSSQLIVHRDIATPLDVIFDIESLRGHYLNITTAEMILAARLCGAQHLQIRGKWRWADSDQARFVLDSETIKVPE